MLRTKMNVAVFFASLALVNVGTDPSAAPSRNASLQVFAASSVTGCFTQIAQRFEETYRGTVVEIHFAGTPTLRTQIEQGATADVFASADRVHTTALEKQNLLRPAATFAHNKLILVTPAGSGLVQNLVDLARPGLKIVVAERAVPAGRYAEEILRKIEAAQIGGEDFVARVKNNFVSRETNVRAVLSKVALSEADAGFVYRTDVATARNKIRTVEIPDSLNAIAEYSIGIVEGSSFPPLAKAFVAMVMSSEGQAILREHGFQP